MENVFKPKGALKSQKPDSGGAVLRELPMIGVVKDNVDPTRAGRIRVYISALGGKDPDDEKNWTPLLYMSPFFGVTDPSGGNNDYGSFKANPASYGLWNSPPDIGTTVICLFINGDPNFGFYIGALPEAEALRMVPAIGGNFSAQGEKVIFNDSEASKYGGATRVPVTNMNTNNSNQVNSSTFLTAPKPVHSFQASIMFQQGVLRDPIRGPISSSAQRESPSRVGWGVSTPGRPIYQGGFTDATVTDAAGKPGQQSNLKVVSRRGGHSIVMDDGDIIGQDNLVRIRTSLGHQILMSDDGQTLMILHSNGQSYIELGKEGTIDMYSTNSVNIRTQGDLNLHADNNININAQKQLNIHADEININSENNINQKAGADYKISTQGTHTHKVGGPMSMASAGDASYASGATTYINGSVINLNTGSTSTTPADIDSIPIIAQTDTLFSKDKGWAAAPGKLLTIVSRAPAHAPWANAGQGVDVKVNLNADAQFPSSASPQVTSANTNASTTPEYPAITVPGAATVPAVPAVSDALDKGTTSALVSASAATAAADAASAVQAGAGVVKDAVGNVTGVSVGVAGLSASALEKASVIKPGSAPLVDSLVKAGQDVTKAMPSNLFTGQKGAPNLNSLVNNVTAQASAVTSNLQQAQSLLTKTGVISGNEGPSAIAGPVLSSALNGVGSTVDAIKNAGAGLNQLQNNIAGAGDAVTKALAGGNFAANLSQNVMSGLSGIATSVKSMTKSLGDIADSAKGVAASAFASVTNSFKAFKPGVPQDLKAISEENKQPDATNATTSASELASGVSNMPGGVGAIGAVVNGSSLPNAGSLLGSGAALAGKVESMVGGLGSTLSQIKTPGAVMNSVSSLINNSVTATTNNISLNSAVSAATGLKLPTVPNLGLSLDKLKAGAGDLTSLASAGLPAGAASQLNSAIASLSSGGPLQIKMPTIALNTTDRGSLADAVGSVLPPGVPAPNFSGVPETAKSALESSQEKIAENAKKIEDLSEKYQAQIVVSQQAEAAYFNAKNQLPPGDPSIQSAKLAWDTEFKKLSEIAKEISALSGINFTLTQQA